MFAWIYKKFNHWIWIQNCHIPLCVYKNKSVTYLLMYMNTCGVSICCPQEHMSQWSVYCRFQRSDLSELRDSDSILLQDNLNKKFGDWQTKRWELVFVLFNIFFLNYFKLKQPICTSSETSTHFLTPQTAYTIDSLELKEMNRNVSHCVC